MPDQSKHRIKVTYQGGLADQHALPGYDGVTSIDGIARALHIATHAYMTGEVVSWATALKNASVVIKPLRPGSFLFELAVFMETYPAVSGAAVGLTAAPFYDFLKVAFKRAAGLLDIEPTNAHLKKYTREKSLLLTVCVHQQTLTTLLKNLKEICKMLIG